MTDSQKLKAELEAKRAEYAEATETRQANLLLSEVSQLEAEYRRALTDEQRDIEASRDGESREQQAIAGEVRMSNYLTAALHQQPVAGAEGEHNASLGLSGNQLPLSMLAPERRATTDTESAVMQGSWLDRLFADTASSQLGVTMTAVPAGVSSYPLTATGPTPAQRARGEAAADGSWSVSVTELRPKRMAVKLTVSIEDEARLPMLEDALRRDLQASLTERLDRTIFTGDSSADGTAADITGFQTAAVGESTITQAAKLTTTGWMATFASYIDGLHASTPMDIRPVLTTGSNSLLLTQIANASAENQTLSQWLRMSGINWTVRGGLESATTAGKFAGYCGLSRGQTNAAVMAVWQAGQLVVDVYSGAAKGERILTLSALYDFAIPRPSSFKRLKYVA